MLDDLVGVIEKLQGRIRDHGDVLRQNEIRTRVALIDPLLQALGWDVADPGLAIPEYEIGGQRVDYALLGTDGKPAATVEAKKLGENLAASRMQMLNYSNAAGIAYAGLTDGNQWELYEVFKQVTLEERRLLDLRILDTPAHECALKLLLLWRPNLATGRPAAAVEPIISPPVAPVAPTPAATVVNPQPSVPAGDDWVDVSLYTPERRDSPKPMAILFPGEREKPIQSWRQALRETAEWLIRTNQLTADKCPVLRGITTCVVNTTSHHANGTDFRQPSRLSNGLYINQRRGNVEVSESTKALLRRFDVDAGAVWLKLNP